MSITWNKTRRNHVDHEEIKIMFAILLKITYEYNIKLKTNHQTFEN